MTSTSVEPAIHLPDDENSGLKEVLNDIAATKNEPNDTSVVPGEVIVISMNELKSPDKAISVTVPDSAVRHPAAAVSQFPEPHALSGCEPTTPNAVVTVAVPNSPATVDPIVPRPEGYSPVHASRAICKKEVGTDNPVIELPKLRRGQMTSRGGGSRVRQDVKNEAANGPSGDDDDDGPSSPLEFPSSSSGEDLVSGLPCSGRGSGVDEWLDKVSCPLTSGCILEPDEEVLPPFLM